MDISTLLILTTLATITNQEPTTRFVTWQNYEIYKDDCPINKELWNPYQKDNHQLPATICLCEGNYKEQSKKRYNHGPYHECPKLEKVSFSPDANDAFLLCWKKHTRSPENLYTLTVPTKYTYITPPVKSSGETTKVTIMPLFFTKYPHVLAQLNSDRRCNFQLSEQLRNQKLQLRDVCSYRGQKHKKNHR